MTEATFRTVLRGYEPTEVDTQFRSLSQSLDRARNEVGELNVELSKARSENETIRQALAEAEQRVASEAAARETVQRSNFSDLGERIGNILTLAEQEADDMVRGAKKEAQQQLETAAQKAETMVAEADRYSVETRSQADANAAALLAEAKAKSDAILDEADREAVARREEGEAAYEAQQARAAQAAADFEHTLNQRREASEAEFSVQIEQHKKQLQDAEDHLTSSENEARRIVADAKSQAEDLRRNARSEAEAMVTEAKQSAERIRRESDRELAAISQRRDAITAQLTNVRQMLSTFGGGAALAAVDNAAALATEDAAAPETNDADAEEGATD